MSENSNTYLVPGAIVFAGLIIAGAVVYTNSSDIGSAAPARGGNEQTANIKGFRPVSDEDHIRGNPDAAITVVEFSDFECPFCKRFHPTMTRVTEEFNDVRWVYRHFPLTSIHSNAQDAAVASECVAQIGDNDAFWQFTDSVFENQDQLGDELYEEIVGNLDIDTEAFNTCFESRETLDDVNADLKEAVASGGAGTPFSVIIGPDGQLTSFSGALPYENVIVVIDQVRTNQ